MTCVQKTYPLDPLGGFLQGDLRELYDDRRTHPSVSFSLQTREPRDKNKPFLIPVHERWSDNFIKVSEKQKKKKGVFQLYVNFVKDRQRNNDLFHRIPAQPPACPTMSCSPKDRTHFGLANLNLCEVPLRHNRGL